MTKWDLHSVEFPLRWLSQIFAVSFQSSLPSGDHLGNTAVPHDGFSLLLLLQISSSLWHPSSLQLSSLLISDEVTGGCTFPPPWKCPGNKHNLLHAHRQSMQRDDSWDGFLQDSSGSTFLWLFLSWKHVYQLNQKHNLDFILDGLPGAVARILQCRAKANLIVQGLTSWKSRNS